MSVTVKAAFIAGGAAIVTASITSLVAYFADTEEPDRQAPTIIQQTEGDNSSAISHIEGAVVITNGYIDKTKDEPNKKEE